MKKLITYLESTGRLDAASFLLAATGAFISLTAAVWFANTGNEAAIIPFAFVTLIFLSRVLIALKNEVISFHTPIVTPVQEKPAPETKAPEPVYEEFCIAEEYKSFYVAFHDFILDVLETGSTSRNVLCRAGWKQEAYHSFMAVLEPAGVIRPSEGKGSSKAIMPLVAQVLATNGVEYANKLVWRMLDSYAEMDLSGAVEELLYSNITIENYKGGINTTIYSDEFEEAVA